MGNEGVMNICLKFALAREKPEADYVSLTSEATGLGSLILSWVELRNICATKVLEEMEILTIFLAIVLVFGGGTAILAVQVIDVSRVWLSFVLRFACILLGIVLIGLGFSIVLITRDLLELNL